MSSFELDESYSPIFWRRIRAINGRGELLLGPDKRCNGLGAMVIAPPGVLLRTPPNSPEPLSYRGWRQARWGPDSGGRVLVDQARPKALMDVGLAEVVEDLADWSPEHLEWVARIIERNMRVLIGRMRPDWRGLRERGYETAYDELTELHVSADEAFGRVRHIVDVPAWLTDGHFSLMRHSYLATIAHDKTEFAKALPRPAKGQVADGRRHLRAVPNFDRDPNPNPASGQQDH